MRLDALFQAGRRPRPWRYSVGAEDRAGKYGAKGARHSEQATESISPNLRAQRGSGRAQLGSRSRRDTAEVHTLRNELSQCPGLERPSTFGRRQKRIKLRPDTTSGLVSRSPKRRAAVVQHRSCAPHILPGPAPASGDRNNRTTEWVRKAVLECVDVEEHRCAAGAAKTAARSGVSAR
jgi:hypothetical protein